MSAARNWVGAPVAVTALASEQLEVLCRKMEELHLDPETVATRVSELGPGRVARLLCKLYVDAAEAAKAANDLDTSPAEMADSLEDLFMKIGFVATGAAPEK